MTSYRKNLAGWVQGEVWSSIYWDGRIPAWPHRGVGWDKWGDTSCESPCVDELVCLMNQALEEADGS